MKRTGLAATTALVTMAALACGCTNDIDNGGFKSGSALSIGTVTTERMLTRSVITGTAFPADEAAKGIGLFLTATDGGNYDDQTSGCSNIKYSDNGSGWTSDSPIMLSATEGKLYGYFPYSASVTDLTAIPVESSLDGTDYMYATPVTGV